MKAYREKVMQEERSQDEIERYRIEHTDQHNLSHQQTSTEQYLEQLNKRVDFLYQQGQYEGAIHIARQICIFTNTQLGDSFAYFESLKRLAELYEAGDHISEAQEVYLMALDVGRLIRGENHSDHAELLERLGLLAHHAGKSEQALSFLLQALKIRLTVTGENDHYDVATSLVNLGGLYWAMGNNEASKNSYEELLAICKRSLGEEHPYFVFALEKLAVLYQLGKDYATAEQFYIRLLETLKQTYGESHPNSVKIANALGEMYWLSDQYSKALPVLEQVAEFQRKYVEDSLERVPTLDKLTEIYQHKADYPTAIHYCNQALALRRAVYKDDHPNVAKSLNDLATLYELQGHYADAEPLFREALRINRATLDQEHKYVLNVMNNLAKLCASRGNYMEAQQLYQQVLVIRQRRFGETAPELVNNLNNLAAVYIELNNFDEAETLLRRSLAIVEDTSDSDHPLITSVLNNLATLYDKIGWYDKAILLQEQALELRRRLFGNHHPDIAQCLHNLASTYSMLGSYEDAEAYYRQALDIARAVLGERHPDFSNYLYSLAGICSNKGNYREAERLELEAFEIRYEALGEMHPRTAESLNALGLLYSKMNDDARAIYMLEWAIRVANATLEKDNLSTASSLNNLAAIFQRMDNYSEAETHHKEALAIRRKRLGEHHPIVAESLSNLALVYIATNRLSEAVTMMEQVNTIDEQIMSRVFSIGTEKQRMAYLATLYFHLALSLSLTRHSVVASPQDVLDLVFRRKALGAEVLAMQRDAVLGGRYPHLQEQLRALTMLRGQIARYTLEGLEKDGAEIYQQRLAEWNSQRERLEADLVRQIPEMDIVQKLRVADRQAVASALPKDAVLIEFVRFIALDVQELHTQQDFAGREVYYAFVLFPEADGHVHLIELGAAETIDQQIATFRGSITGEVEEDVVQGLKNTHSDPESLFDEAEEHSRHASAVSARPGKDVFIDTGKALRTQIFDPLLTAISKRKRLLISPDGDLARLPFEILPTDDGHYLIDEYRISYLSVGRDAIRFGAPPPKKPAVPLVVADPDFDLNGTVMAVQEEFELNERRSRDLRRSAFHFPPLPGTRIEGERIAAQLGVEPLLKGAALESAIKTYPSPHILHIATHGFFLANQKQMRQQGWMDLSTQGKEDLLSQLENPLLRSGLVLAGANSWFQGKTLPANAEDGLLTAEDVGGLDLLGTELVVLSACETGLGERHVGEGVFGLRRTFMLAGASRLVMSLWKVSDQQTQELMVDFYQRLLEGTPCADALREAQLSMKAKYHNPFYWGAFICQGDPGPLA
jgi:CHAT domain-containing protein/tetratricopeptide (TPR) repeat protein